MIIQSYKAFLVDRFWQDKYESEISISFSKELRVADSVIFTGPQSDVRILCSSGYLRFRLSKSLSAKRLL